MSNLKIKKSKKQYENFLNSISPVQGSEEWIIGGTIRYYHMWKNQYGTAIRKFDPITFEVGFNDFLKN
jgi:hypothetical protein